MNINQTQPIPQLQNLPLQQQLPQQQLFQAVPHQAAPLTQRASEPGDKTNTRNRHLKREDESIHKNFNNRDDDTVRGHKIDRSV